MKRVFLLLVLTALSNAVRTYAAANPAAANFEAAKRRAARGGVARPSSEQSSLLTKGAPGDYPNDEMVTSKPLQITEGYNALEANIAEEDAVDVNAASAAGRSDETHLDPATTTEHEPATVEEEAEDADELEPKPAENAGDGPVVEPQQAEEEEEEVVEHAATTTEHEEDQKQPDPDAAGEERDEDADELETEAAANNVDGTVVEPQQEVEEEEEEVDETTTEQLNTGEAEVEGKSTPSATDTAATTTTTTYLPDEWSADKILEVYGKPTEPEFSTRLGQAIVTSCTNPNPTPNTPRMTIGSYDKAIEALDSLEKTPQVAIAKYRLGIEKARLSNSSNPFPNHETEYAAAHAASQELGSGYDIKQFNPALSNSIMYSADPVDSVSSEAIKDFRMSTGSAYSWSQDFKTIKPGEVSESDDKLKKLLEKSPQATAEQWKEYHKESIKGKKDSAIKADIMDRVEYSNPDEPPQNHYVHHLEGLEVTTFEKWAEAAKTSAEYQELTDAIYTAAATSKQSTMTPNTHQASLQAKQLDTFKQWPITARTSEEDILIYNQCIQKAINANPSAQIATELQNLKTTPSPTLDEPAAAVPKVKKQVSFAAESEIREYKTSEPVSSTATNAAPVPGTGGTKTSDPATTSASESDPEGDPAATTTLASASSASLSFGATSASASDPEGDPAATTTSTSASSASLSFGETSTTPTTPDPTLDEPAGAKITPVEESTEERRATINAADGPDLPNLEGQCRRYMVMHQEIRKTDEVQGTLADPNAYTDKDIQFIKDIMQESKDEANHSELKGFATENESFLRSETSEFRKQLQQNENLRENLTQAIIADLAHTGAEYHVDSSIPYRSGKQQAPKWVEERTQEVHDRYGIKRFTGKGAGGGLEKGKQSLGEFLSRGKEGRHKFGISFSINTDGSISIGPQSPNMLARSIIASIMARGKLGKPVNVDLKAKDPYQLQDEISALIDQADKQGIPLDQITISTSNFNSDNNDNQFAKCTLAEMVERRAQGKPSGFIDAQKRDASKRGYQFSSNGIISKKKCQEIVRKGSTLSTAGHPYRNQDDGALYLSKEKQADRTTALKQDEKDVEGIKFDSQEE